MKDLLLAAAERRPGGSSPGYVRHRTDREGPGDYLPYMAPLQRFGWTPPGSG
ncbi:MAG: hypothetical protein HGA75_07215 [Thiobacillus sp.]|nr:hypothetical protein [Thiobacillus sp.]